jgi:secondary thiamine-phosphate synthase enzyme
MVFQKEFYLDSKRRGCHLITREIIDRMPKVDGNGILHLFIKHTSAGLTLNENADPSVRVDFNNFLDTMIPENHPVYTHVLEGPDDMPAHLKSSIVGNSVTVPITNGRLNLGTWQGIYLCEFRDHGGSRKLVLSVYT